MMAYVFVSNIRNVKKKVTLSLTFYFIKFVYFHTTPLHIYRLSTINTSILILFLILYTRHLFKIEFSCEKINIYLFYYTLSSRVF